MNKEKTTQTSWIITALVIVATVVALFVVYGIDWVTITCALCLPIVGVLVTACYLEFKYGDHRKGDNCFAIIAFLIVMLLLIILVCGWFYNDAISLPHNYKASVNTVEETNALLLKFENNLTLAGGLEAFELKGILKDAIEKKNDLRAEIDIWLANPFAPYKDVLRENLKGVEI